MTLIEAGDLVEAHSGKGCIDLELEVQMAQFNCDIQLAKRRGKVQAFIDLPGLQAIT